MDALDTILGRRSLKERVASLIEERDRLAAQLEAETDRRRDAVRERQSAEERVNHLEDRVAGLEGELERHRSDTDERSWSRVVTVDRGRAGDLVDVLAGVRTTTEGALSAAVHEAIPEEVRSELDAWELVDRAAPCLVFLDDHHLIRCILAPPRMPSPFVTWDDRFHLDRSWMMPTEGDGFALARADLFALGTVEDSTIQFDRGFESDVMGRHDKGGFSQARFERRREAQIDDHVDRCREALREVGERHVLVGDRRIVTRLDDLASVTDTVDATGRPKGALQDAFDAFWTSRLYVP